MDFGSSHVYAGSPYYSDVPKEDDNEETKTRDTIYEALHEANEEHEYDPVAFEPTPIERREYDLVPYEPHLDTTNADQGVYEGVRHAPPKRSLSAVLHKAKKVNIFKQKKKPHKSTGSNSEIEADRPPPPVARRPTQNKPLPPLPASHSNKPLPPIPTSSDSRPTLPPKPPSLRSPSVKQDNSVDQLAEIFSEYDIAKDTSVPLKPSVINSVTPALYPALPNEYSEVNRNYDKPPVVATAPVLESTVATKNAKPSAPKLSESMVKRETREKKKQANKYSAADTNVVSVKLEILESNEKTVIWAMPPNTCKTCQAVLLHHTIGQDPSLCRFCGNFNANINEAELPLAGHESDITYILGQSSVENDDPIIVFCVDTSGSMCVTSEIQNCLTNGTCFMSRLQAVQDGIMKQLDLLRKTKPKARVALVTFSNMVIWLGDGSADQCMSFSDAQLYDTDYIAAVSSNMILPGCIGQTYMQLAKTLSKLKEHGGTALGPALFLSVALASRKSGSQVIVCTDGRANVGVGSLELESDYKMCHNFYKETSEYGISYGTMVSILSIEGTDCRLVELGKVADKTAGKVKIGKVEKIGEELQDVVSASLMATQVDVKITTQKGLYFHEPHANCSSLTRNFVGNVTKDTEITFKYGIEESEQSSPPETALFQLQIQYKLPNGCTSLRVVTQSRPVTENRMLAEQGLNPAVVGTYASQLASKLVLDGDLRDAKLTTDAHKNLINRAMSIRSITTDVEDDDRIYGSVCYHMDELNYEIRRVAQSVAAPSPTPSSRSDVPPPLPPRLAGTPDTLSRSSSMSSLSLPDVPNTPLPTREKLMEAVENCPDEVATNLYKHRNACGKMFAAF